MTDVRKHISTIDDDAFKWVDVVPRVLSLRLTMNDMAKGPKATHWQMFLRTFVELSPEPLVRNKCLTLYISIFSMFRILYASGLWSTVKSSSFAVVKNQAQLNFVGGDDRGAEERGEGGGCFIVGENAKLLSGLKHIATQTARAGELSFKCHTNIKS